MVGGTKQTTDAKYAVPDVGSPYILLTYPDWELFYPQIIKASPDFNCLTDLFICVSNQASCSTYVKNLPNLEWKVDSTTYTMPPQAYT